MNITEIRCPDFAAIAEAVAAEKIGANGELSGRVRTLTLEGLAIVLNRTYQLASRRWNRLTDQGLGHLLGEDEGDPMKVCCCEAHYLLRVGRESSKSPSTCPGMLSCLAEVVGYASEAEGGALKPSLLSRRIRSAWSAGVKQMALFDKGR